MPAGRPRKFRPEEVKLFADVFYSDFRRITEGHTRKRLDRDLLNRIVRDLEKEGVQLSPNERLRNANFIDEEIRAGRIPIEERETRLRHSEDSLLWMKRYGLYEQAAKQATMTLNVPGEPDVIDALLAANTPEDIREICKDAFDLFMREVRSGEYREVRLANWPISNGSMLPEYLSQYAEQFIEAKNDPRFPRSSDRPTTKLKRLWFLSRALAGALFGIRTRTAINLLGSIRPEQLEELDFGKLARKTRTRKERG